jgi:uncharacterized membrane protein
MTMKRALQSILALSLFGVLFSCFLSYQELFGGSKMSCPSPGAPGTIFGYPACVYGFFMFLAVAILATLGLGSAARSPGIEPPPRP